MHASAPCVFVVTLQLSTGQDGIAIESALLMEGLQGLVFLSITLHSCNAKNGSWDIVSAQ